MKVAILDDYQQVALKMADWSTLPDVTEVRAFREHWTGIDALADRLIGFDIIVAMRERTPFPEELIERLPRLRLLVSTGMRNASIDLAAATRLGILVCGTKGGGPSTAELAWGLILSLLRHIQQEHESVRQGRWQSTIGVELKGKVLGLLGLGNLGSHMAEIGNAFGMTVIAWSQNLTADRAAQFKAGLVGKDELFSRSDILSIHLQLSDRTRGLVGARELGLMRPTAYLINTSRGPIVDETALLQALQSRTIAGAGIDVYSQEPLPPHYPFARLDNVVLTPHLGYVTEETYEVFYRDSVEDIASYLRGQPVRVLNPDVIGRIRGAGADNANS
ncbi:MAG: hydroxyacid dehydrogenase [Chloroflexi bacterium RBG_16_57_8]|nr:MAG: hydroxyacid dehydrogenase [Chloroflexi bacterium RBG_16_57_8]